MLACGPATVDVCELSRTKDSQATLLDIRTQEVWAGPTGPASL